MLMFHGTFCHLVLLIYLSSMVQPSLQQEEGISLVGVPQQQALDCTCNSSSSSSSSSQSSNRHHDGHNSTPHYKGVWRQRLHQHQFVASPSVLRMGVNMPTSWRLLKLAHKLLTGEPVSIGAVGGSITWGHAEGVQKDKTDWIALVATWLRETFPENKINSTNSAVPGTQSSLMLGCSRLFGVDYNMDLVFVEYILNDGVQKDGIVPDSMFGLDRRQTRLWEQLYRKFLNFPNKPAVVHMAVPGHAMACGEKKFWETAEDQYNLIAQYYGQASLSVRNAVFMPHELNMTHHMQGNFSSWFNIDCFHLNARGHRLMADLAISMIKEALHYVLKRGYHEFEQDMANAPLLTPMFPNNEPPPDADCIMGQALESSLVSADRFTLVNEGTVVKPKIGYVANEAGAALTLKFHTNAGSNQQLAILHLKSYEHMGRAEVACVESCTCNPPSAILDGHHNQTWSQLVTTQFATMDAPKGECMLKFTVLSDTSSGERKFKLGGVMIGGSWYDGYVMPLDHVR